MGRNSLVEVKIALVAGAKTSFVMPLSQAVSHEDAYCLLLRRELAL